MSEKTEVAKCEFCGCEYNAAKTDCPNCNLTGGIILGRAEDAPLQRSILDLVTDTSGQYVRELDRARCSTCLRRLSCCLVSQARKAKPGMLIAGLVIDGRNLRCRQYKYAGGNRRPATRRVSQQKTPELL